MASGEAQAGETHAEQQQGRWLRHVVVRLLHYEAADAIVVVETGRIEIEHGAGRQTCAAENSKVVIGARKTASRQGPKGRAESPARLAAGRL